MCTGLIVGFALFVIFLTFILESQWVKDIRYNKAKYLKTPSREKFVPKYSNSLSIIENHETSKASYFTPESNNVSPSDWNYKVSCFSPSSFTNVLRERHDYTSEPQKSGVNPYCPEPTFVKNQRIKGQQLIETNKPKNVKETSPELVKKATERYWNKASPASTMNMKDEGNYPTVIPSIVKKQAKGKESSSSTGGQAAAGKSLLQPKSAGGFALPGKPVVTDDSKPASESGTAPKSKIGLGLKLNLNKQK